MVSIHGKLSLASSEFSGVQPGEAHTKGSLRIGYQRVAGLDFPARIRQTATREVHGSSLRTEWDISLKDCAVTK